MRHMTIMLALTIGCSSPAFEIGYDPTEVGPEVIDLGSIEIDVRPRPGDAGSADVVADVQANDPFISCNATSTCALRTETCCVVTGSPTCAASCPTEKSYACDSSSDCPSGQSCFLMFAGGSRCGATGDALLCVTNDDCPSKMCVDYSSAPRLRKCVS